MSGSLRAASLLSLFQVCVLASACSSADADPPDIVVISLDTMNPSALRAFAPEAAPLPALDAFAETCVRFTNAFSPSSWTLPAHASLFTGLYPDRHGATDRRVTLPDNVATLAASLKRRGYRTVGFSGGGFLDPKFGMGRGFDHYESAVKTKRGPAESASELLERVRTFFAERAQDDAPVFLFLHTYSVHNYYDARPEVVQSLSDETLLTRKQYVDCVLGRVQGAPETWDQLERMYRVEQELFDRAFGELVEELELAGIWDQAAVFFLSDHGEGFDPQRNRIHHGGRLHADQLRIPLLARIPGVAPREEQTPVSLIDVMPTLLELAGTAPRPDLDGVSFASVLRGSGRLGLRPLFGMEHCFGWENGKRVVAEEIQELPLAMAVIRDESWYIQGADGEELYDYRSDPRQQVGLEVVGPNADALRTLLSGRRRSRPDTHLLEPDEELQSALDDLGYSGEE